MRGHGSNESILCGTLERQADDLAAIIRKIPDPKGLVVLIGHSLGAQIAMMTVVRYPSLVDAMVLLDPLIQEALTAETFQKMKWKPFIRAGEFFFRFLNRWGIRRHLPKYNLRKEDERARQMILEGGEAFEAFVREFSSPWNEIVHVHIATYLRDLLEVSRPTPPVYQLNCPTLVVAAETGVFTNSQKIKKWVRHLNNGEYSVVHCVHWPLTECPVEIKETIESWMKRKFFFDGEKKEPHDK
ncbi:alpha/beta hydrolase fold protein [gut metagenome]|uniref:Alpha/beta hydrolase fold protein n=1 Tax=gut metagenome TaxID=749906 RepID=J9H4F5_9ZZZZ